MAVRAVLFDFSGTLFRLEPSESWWDGVRYVDGRTPSDDDRAYLLDRLVVPVGVPTELDAELAALWPSRDLSQDNHRACYVGLLRALGLDEPSVEQLYARTVDPDCWIRYPDTVGVLGRLRAVGVLTAVVSNISFDIRKVFAASDVEVDHYSLSYEVGAMKPDLGGFRDAIAALGVKAEETLMIGDSAKADGAAAELGCAVAIVEPLPTSDRRDAVLRALVERSVLG